MEFLSPKGHNSFARCSVTVFTSSKLNILTLFLKKLIKELATMSFVHRAENEIFLVPPGVGKTHLTIALAIEALSRGISVYFTNLLRLIDELKKAHKESRLEKRMRIYTWPKLL